VDGCGLLIAGGDAATLLQAVDAALDGVALLVRLAVEGRRSPARLSAPAPVGLLVGPFRDHRRIPRRRRWSRIAREEYVLSARTRSGLVRGRPGGRGTRRRAMTPVKAGASPAWPSVRTNASGRHRPSATRWIFVVSPFAGPADGVVAWFTDRCPFLRAPAAVLVSAHDGGVHKHGPADIVVHVGLGHQGGEHPLPGAVDGPHPQPVVHAPPVAEPLRQVHPLGTGLELEGDRVDHLTMVPPAATPTRRPVRKQRLDPRPLRISQRHTRTNDRPIQTKPAS